MAEYRNPYQWNTQAVEWDPNAPRQSPWDVTFEQVNPGYISGLMALDARVRSGQATPEERQQYEAQAAAARAIPMRDPSTLQFGWNTDEVGSWDEGGSDWWTMLNGSSPDLGPVMLSLADRMQHGQATDQERQLYQQMLRYDTDWGVRASLPQASDAFSLLGNDLFGPLMTLALGATGGLAAAPLAAGGAGLTTTLGSLGTLAGVGGTAAGALGAEMDQDWLSNLGLALGAAGGLAGGAAGLARLAGTGVQSLGDAARLAQSAGRITGTAGRLSGNDALTQAGGYLGTAGGLGTGVDNLANLLSGTGGSLQGVLGLLRPLAGLAGRFLQPGQSGQAGQSGQSGSQRPVSAAPQRPLDGESAAQPGTSSPGAGAARIQALLQAARQAQQRGMQGPVPPSMTNQDWLRWDWQTPQATPQSVIGNL